MNVLKRKYDRHHGIFPLFKARITNLNIKTDRSIDWAATWETRTPYMCTWWRHSSPYSYHQYRKSLHILSWGRSMIRRCFMQRLSPDYANAQSDQSFCSMHFRRYLYLMNRLNYIITLLNVSYDKIKGADWENGGKEQKAQWIQIN